MAIYFKCSCGRRLKARHRQRGYISFCPGCGAAVKVPTGKATHRGVAALSEDERLATPFPVTRATPLAPPDPIGFDREPAASPAIPSTNSAVDDAPRQSAATPGPTAAIADSQSTISFRGQRLGAPSARSRDAGETWFESVQYTVPVVPILLLLSLFLTVSLGVVLRGLADSNAVAPAGDMRPLLVPGAAMLLGFLACTCGLLSNILGLSLEGSPRVAGLPSIDAVLRAIAQWTACFLAGPALLLGAAAMYWISVGDPALVDEIILVELIALSIGWFLAGLVSTTGSGWFWQFHPAAVINTAKTQIGWFAVASLGGTALIYGLARFGSFAIARVHLAAFEGSLWLGLFWFAALASAAWSFRRLGLRQQRPAVQIVPPKPRALPSAKQRGSRIAISRTPG
jgi:hypothetical protein